MDRRDFLRVTGLASAGLAFGRGQLFAAPQAPEWRTFDITTDIEVLNPSGVTRVWLPLPLTVDRAYQRAADKPVFKADGGTAKVVTDPKSGAAILAAEWPAGTTPALSSTSRVATRNIAVDPAARGAKALTAAERARYLAPTSMLPTDGIVLATASGIVKGATSDVEKARAIYDWIVENTYREASVKGCGVGDIRFMLESKNLGGKCADLNALYVGLARAAGLPSRDDYGIRLVKSDLGYKSLGASSEVISKSQHCRAEVFLSGAGWTPVDPADVRKVILEEPPGNLPVDDAKVTSARQRLFGSWEMNWMAYNDAHDVALPGSTGAPVPFLMYPQAEVGGHRVDSLDPDHFRYRIVARQVTSA